jgi:uncharacterized membrane protein
MSLQGLDFWKDMPLVAGTVVWSRGLIERIKAPMDKLLALNRTLRILNLDRPEDKATQTVEFYHQLVRTIGEYPRSFNILFLSYPNSLHIILTIHNFDNKKLV